MLYKEKDQIQIHKFLEKSFTDSEPELSFIADLYARYGIDMTQPAVKPSAVGGYKELSRSNQYPT